MNGYVIFVTRQYQSFLSFTVAINANTSKFNLFQWFYIHLLKKGCQQPIIYVHQPSFTYQHLHIFLIASTSLFTLSNITSSFVSCLHTTKSNTTLNRSLCAVCNAEELEKQTVVQLEKLKAQQQPETTIKRPLPSVPTSKATNATKTIKTTNNINNTSTPSPTPSNTTKTINTTNNINNTNTPSPPITPKKTTKTKSPRRWALVKVKLQAKEDAFKDIESITSRCDIKSLSIAVKAARDTLKTQVAKAKLDAKRALKRRNLEYKQRMTNVKGKDEKALNAEINAARKKIKQDTQQRKTEEEEQRNLENKLHRAKLNATKSGDQKQLDEELLRKRKKMNESKAKARENRRKAQKKHALRQREKIKQVKAKADAKMSNETIEKRKQIAEESARKKKEQQDKMSKENLLWSAKKELLGQE